MREQFIFPPPRRYRSRVSQVALRKIDPKRAKMGEGEIQNMCLFVFFTQEEILFRSSFAVDGPID